MRAIRVSETGGAEKLILQAIPVPEPGPTDVLIHIKAIGVNYIDTYHRTGLYKLDLPFTPGVEASGVVEKVGAEVIGFKPGDRVAYAMSRGSYAEYAVVPESWLVTVPEEVTFEQAAATMLQGMTAHYLTRSTFPLGPAHTALVHASAGGTGLLVVQLAKLAGATVIGTAGTRRKADLARDAGADHVILYDDQDFEAEVKQITGGKGVDVVYDSVGVKTFKKSLNCLRPRGMMVTFGQSSGPVPPFDLLDLSTRGSLFVTRPTLAHYIAKREELTWRAGELFAALIDATISVRIGARYALADVQKAHLDLEGRKTTGKVILLP